MNAPGIITAAQARHAQCVYMLTDGHRVKIGTTGNLTSRIASLSGACGVRLEILRVIDHAGPRIERWLHKRFSDARLHGEWFGFRDEMLTITPPEEVASIPVVHVRRDVRLTLKERLKRSEASAEGLDLTARERLLLMATAMDDAEADKVVDLIRDFVERRSVGAA